MTRPVFRPCVIVPVFDHAATVADVAEGAAHHAEAVIVVDDGSRDGSGDAVRSAAGPAIEVLSFPENRGKGAAIAAGLRRAAERGFTHAVTIDADGQHAADDIPALLAASRARPDAIVVGARDLGGAEVPSGSRVGRAVSNFWILRTTGFDLPDTQSGFRCMPIAPVLALPLRCSRYDFEVEVLVRAAWAGLTLTAVPIRVHYPPRSERISHFRAFADNVRISRTYTRLAVRRLLPVRGAWSTQQGPARQRVRLRDAPALLRRLGGEGTRPSEIALAVATGVLVGASPLWGLHAALAIWICVRWHLNAVAAFLGSNVSMPLTAPYLVFASVQCGHRLLHGSFLDLDPSGLGPAGVRVFLADYVVGSIPVAVALSLAAGLVTWAMARALRRSA